MIIYEIVCNISGERYIGSTKNTLNKRMWHHIYNATYKGSRNVTSKQIILRGDYQANILEEGDFDRHEREQYYIQTLENINDRNACGRNYKRIRENDNRLTRYKRSWGDERRHNNLLKISMDVFQ